MDKPYPVLNTHTLSYNADLTTEKKDTAASITLLSPALSVITDLRLVEAISIKSDSNLDQAHSLMIARAVRLLFVVNQQNEFVGLITAHDILGEKPVALHKRHADISVSEVMQEKHHISAIDYHELAQANVGSLIATMKKIGHQHALVVRKEEDEDQESVIGLVSTSQIANLTGIPLNTVS